MKTIQRIIYDENFDMLNAMEEHLQALEKQKKETENLILTVKKTIQSMKGECEMSNKEKFQALKEKAVRENEEMYGAEAREKYGDEEVHTFNQKMLNMTEVQWERFKELEKVILMRLEEAVEHKTEAESEAAKTIVELHKEWLCMTWKQYSAEAHKGVAMMYVADERFTKYYDRNVQGCARLLCKAVQYWAGK